MVALRYGVVAFLLLLLVDLFPPTREWLEGVERVLLDARTQLEAIGRHGEEPQGPAVVVGIDQATHAALGKTPKIFWPRYLVEVIRGCLDGGAEVVFLDILFESSGGEFLREQLGERAEGNRFVEGEEALAALVATGRVVVAGFLDQPNRTFRRLSPAIVGAAEPEQIGVVNTIVDPDRVVRRYPILLKDAEHRPWYSSVAAIFRKLRPEGIRIDPIGERIMIGEKPLPDGTHDLRLLPLKEGGRFFRIRYRPATAGPQYQSFIELLNRARAGDRSFFERFRGKAVLVGERIPLEDQHRTPLDTPTPVRALGKGGLSREQMYGIQIVAHGVNTLAAGLTLAPLPGWARLGLAAVAAFLGAGVAARLQPLTALPLVAALAAGWWLTACRAYEAGWIVLVAAPLAALSLGALLTYLDLFYAEMRERRRIRALLIGYVSKPVLDEVLALPEHRRLEARSATLAILFLDIRGFTALSERLPAATLVGQLNEFLAEMIAAIHETRGTVNKFTGDGMLAFWGAPLPDPNPSLSAVLGAVAMQRRLALLNAAWEARGDPPLQIGVGIHRGEVMVGHVGSPDRMEYTVIGEPVNLASRIEALNKTYGSTILVSHAVWGDLHGQVAGESVGAAEIRGITHPVELYRIDVLS